MTHISASDVDNCVVKITESIDIIRRGSVVADQMREAHMVIETINSNTNVESTLQVAYKLITFNGDEALTQSVKHFGLQLVENCIKYKWTEISDTTKAEIKAVLEKMIYETLIGKDLKLLKEGISKCVVEAMKREWPGNWSHLMTLMLGHKLNDRVLFIIGRLSEELGIFYSPANRDRRRDMTNELKNNYPVILTYIAECLISGNSDLCSSALRTLAPFLEWHTFDEPLLSFLCDLLAADIDPNRDREQLHIKIQTTDCLLTILFRKGSKKDRINILDLFTPKNVTSIFKCIDSILPRINVNNYQLSNDYFTLAKRVYSVLTMMGQTAIQLHPVKQLPMETWQIYTQKMHSLFYIDNYILNAFVLQFWRDLAKSKEHQTIITEPLLTSLLSIIPEKLYKRPFGDPSIPMEFDDEEDYDVFFIKFKAELTDLVRSLTLYREDICFNFASNLLMATQIKKESGPDTSANFKWEITAHIMEAVCNRLTNVQAFCLQGSPLLNMLVKSEGTDTSVEILSSQLSCLSALTVFVPHLLSQEPNLISALLEKMFKLAAYELPGESKDNRSKSVRNLRRYACALFVKLTRVHSEILFPIFDQLKAHIHKTFALKLEASQTEICTLNEGLMILSNCFTDPAQQSLFVNELLEPLKWFLECYLTPATFISTFGLDKPTVEHESKGQARAQLMYAISTLLGLLKRIKRKEVLYSPVMAFMNPLCSLLSNLNSLWRQEMIILCHTEYQSVVFAPISESDRLSLLEIHNTNNNTSQDESETTSLFKHPAHRMQNFLWTIQDSCCSAIGCAHSLISPELYLEFNNITLALDGFENLPLMKLKSFIRSFLKPFLINYPVNDLNILENKFLPFVKQVLPILFNRIDGTCKIIREREYQKGESEVENELLEEKICRALSIDFIELLSGLIISSKGGGRKADNPMEEDDWEMREMNEQNNKPIEHTVSYIGDYLIKNMPSIITQISFQCLTWSDSTVSWKAGALCEVVLSRLIEHVMVRNPADCQFLLENICKSLRYYGEYEQNRGICLQLVSTIYEKLILVMQFDSVKHYLVQLSEGNMEKWNEFEENWIRKPPMSKNIQKSRREALKDLLDPIIGKSLSIMGRKEQATGGNPVTTIRRKKASDIFNNETIYLYELFI
ncbi:exportin-5-like [Panonychus citri]|uniref:exportin-5-like n=1 Tax=Panonychus citri TaxID=50023 RepID=UPI002307B6DD|nr:exportin-5-like [Panonychus citri]